MAVDGGKGASESLNLTISEIMQHLGDNDERPNANLRAYLREKIGDLAERWYRFGFNRGHRQSHEEFLETGEVPDVLKYECTKKLSPGQERDLTLKSKIKKPKASGRSGLAKAKPRKKGS